MKRFLAFLLALLALCPLALADSTWTCPSCGRGGNTSNYCPSCGAARPVDNGGVWLYANTRVATRSGPGTEYSEPGSFYSAGKWYKVYSQSGIWFQIEVEYCGMTVRVYTGKKRFDYSAADLALIPEETPLYHGKMNEDTAVWSGPDNQLYYRLVKGSLDNSGSKVTIKAGRPVTVYAVENGYAQIDFESGGACYRGWVKENRITRSR